MSWAELEPRELESVTIGSAIGQYGARLIQAGDRKSEWPATRVLPETSPDRVKELRRMGYRAYMESPEWRETAGRMKRLARWKCEDCGAERRLNAHHLTYDRLGAELASDFLVLCHRCHMTFHEIMPEQVRH